MSCSENTDVENTFYLPMSHSRGGLTWQHFQASGKQMKKFRHIDNKKGENSYAYRKSTELGRDA